LKKFSELFEEAISIEEANERVMELLKDPILENKWNLIGFMTLLLGLYMKENGAGNLFFNPAD